MNIGTAAPQNRIPSMVPYTPTQWGLRADRLLEKALYELRSGRDPLPILSAAEAALKIDAGELSEAELDGYPFPGEDQDD